MTNKSKTINYDSPLYLQVRDFIERKIKSKEFLPGMAIPSTNEFARLLGINRLTVNAAFEGLVDEGILKRVQGKGSFVVGKKIAHNLEKLQGFNQTVNGHSIELSIKVLKKYKRVAGKYYAHKFGIKENDLLYYIERLYYIDNSPSSVLETLVLDKIVPKIEGIDLSVFSLNEVYGFYGINLKKGIQTLELVNLDHKEAKLLDLSDNDDALMIDSSIFDKNNNLIEISINYTKSELSEFTVHFKE